MLRLTYIVIVLLFLSSNAAHAQKLIFQNVGIRSGLPSTEVYNLFQDNKGYIWVFTEYGIVKYNGSQYLPVCRNLSLKESGVYAVASSPNGNMFIANAQGNIFRIYKDKAFKVVGINKSVSESHDRGLVIYDLFIDNKNGLYFSTFSKSYYYPTNKYKVIGLPKEKINPKGRKGLYPFKTIVPFAANTGCSVRIIDENRNTRYDWFKTRIYDTRVLVRESKKMTYLCTRQYIIRHDSKGKQKTVLFSSPVINMENDKNGHIWVSLLEGGLIEFDAGLNVLDRYFDKIIVSDILFDDQGGMWVSTIGRGVYHCKDINQKSYSNVPELSESYISVLKETNNRLYAGTFNGNLFELFDNRIQKINVESRSFALMDILFDKGTYLVCTNAGLLVTDKKFKSKNIFEGACYCVAKTDSENVLVVSANSISRFNRRENKFYKNLFRAPRIRSLAKRFGHEYFVPSSNGVVRIRNFKKDTPAYLKTLKEKSILRNISDQLNNIWFCSKGNGIYCLDTRDKLHHYSNLPSKIVNDICFTKEHQIVIATNKGVFAARIDNYLIRSAWKLIFSEEAARITEYQNKLFIGTKRGLTSMNSAELTRKKRYRFHLQSITFKGKEVNLQKDVVVNYNQNDLYFNYDLLNYRSSENELVYKLVGPINLNDVVKGTRIHLQNLSPGEYTLYINPLINGTKVSDVKLVTKFSVRPAFWQTWVFRIVAVIIGLSIVFFIFWGINYRRNKKEMEVNQIENLLTEYRLTALKSQVNPHFMSNSLVAIQRLILEEETDKANQYIAKFSLLLRSLLEYSNRSAATVKNEINMIDLYVELEQLRFSDEFIFELNVGRHINIDSIYMPALITQPFVENAIWHGLLPLANKENAKLTLSVNETKDGIIISIIDNGVGREANPSKKKHGEFESRGTSLIIQRIENLNRLYNSTGSKVEFLDLKDENQKPIGTQVNIILSNEILKELYERRNS